MASSTAPRAATKEFILAPEEELRLELQASQACTITLLRGNAEAFGTELTLDQDYVFDQCDTALAIYTWYGCTLSVSGTPLSAYVANETPMISYINTHAALEQRRQTASQTACDKQGNKPQGPRALIVGPKDAGKSTLSRMLCSYAARAGHNPILVDCDVGQNSISLPGCISATSVEQPISIDSLVQSSDASGLTIKAPLSFYHAHVSPGTQPECYKQLLSEMGASLDARCAALDNARISGCIVNTCGWTDGLGYELLVHTAQALKCDVILVVGQERLYAQLQGDDRITGAKANGGRPVTLAKLAKSGGVLQRDQSTRTHARNSAIRHYFYGVGNTLTPHSKTLAWRDVAVWRYGGGPAAPDTALPIGAKRLIDPHAMHRLSGGLLETLHCVLGVSFAPPVAAVPASQALTGGVAAALAATGNAVLHSNVAGFCFVSAVDPIKKTLTLLCPAPGPLPSNNLILGSIKWQD